MHTLAEITRTLFPNGRAVHRRHSARRDTTSLSQFSAIVFALLPLAAMIHAYTLTA